MGKIINKIRYELKQEPEDFIVKEISDVELSKEGSGRFTYFVLKKRNYTTLRAIQHIADAMRVSPSLFSFAGTKDRIAVTEQLVSARGICKERLEKVKLRDISIRYAGKGDKPLSLGDLEGNEFEITVRKIGKLPKLKPRFKNLFGEQRFSTNNADVGKAIIKKEFRRAVELMLESKGDNEAVLSAYLDEHPTDYVGALRTLPKKLLRLYVHAYQSLLWNELAEMFDDAESLPIIGFGVEIQDKKVKEAVKSIMKREGISESDFIIRSLPGMSAEGSERAVFAEAKELAMEVIGKETVKLKFRLKKGCYATVFIDQLFQEP